jgi:hypothetical protein
MMPNKKKKKFKKKKKQKAYSVNSFRARVGGE